MKIKLFDSNAINSFKIVVVGDYCADKTRFLWAHQTGYFRNEYVSKLRDKHISYTTIDNKRFNFALCDTAGFEDYKLLRSLNYSCVDMVVILFSLVNRGSFYHILDKWYPDVIRNLGENLPYMLVGAHLEQREGQPPLNDIVEHDGAPISFVEGFEMARKINACAYMECSCFSHGGVKAVFDEAMLLAISPEYVDLSRKRLNQRKTVKMLF